MLEIVSGNDRRTNPAWGAQPRKKGFIGRLSRPSKRDKSASLIDVDKSICPRSHCETLARATVPDYSVSVQVSRKDYFQIAWYSLLSSQWDYCNCSVRMGVHAAFLLGALYLLGSAMLVRRKVGSTEKIAQ
jgi:hypothetical protein